MTITNTTLNKLTSQEAQMLDLANYGYSFYRGELKTRKRGFVRENDADGITVRFRNEYGATFEFIKLCSMSVNHTGRMVPDWAMRLYNNETGEYEKCYWIMVGCEFFK